MFRVFWSILGVRSGFGGFRGVFEAVLRVSERFFFAVCGGFESFCVFTAFFVCSVSFRSDFEVVWVSTQLLSF